MHRILPFILLLATYVALSSRFDIATILIGAVMAAGIIRLVRPRKRNIAWSRVPRGFAALITYTAMLIISMLKSAVLVSRMVLHPGLPIRSGIIAVQPDCESETGRAISAFTISTPPGELLIETGDDGAMYIHSLNITDTEKQLASSAAYRQAVLRQLFD